MQRDMDLIREVLIKVEQECGPTGITAFNYEDFKEHDWDIVWAHFGLIHSAGFIDAGRQSLDCNSYHTRGLTWEGHEFLGRIKDQDLWEKTKAGAKKVGDFSVDTLGQIAKAYAKKKFNELTNLELDI